MTNVTNENLKKIVNECLDDPEHGELFKGLFLDVVKVIKDFKGEYDKKRYYHNFNMMKSKFETEKRILEMLKEADYTHSIYVDTDSYILPRIQEDDLLKDYILELTDKKNIVVITGNIGVGKTSVAIRLSEVLRENTPLIFDYAIYRECTIITHGNIEFTVISSLGDIYPYLFSRVGLLINVNYMDRKKKEIHAKVYVFNKEREFIQVLKVYSVIIPFCSKENYEIYRQGLNRSLVKGFLKIKKLY